jgi:hypothetical protein
VACLAQEVVKALVGAVAQSRLGLVEVDSHKVPIAQVGHFPHEPDFSARPVLQLAPLAYDDGAGDRPHVLRVADLGLSGQRVLDLRVFDKEMVLPFSEIFWEVVVGFLGHDVLFDLVAVFDFLEDGARVEVGDADDHAVFDSVEVEGAHVFLHGGDHVAVLVLEGESDVGRF